MVCTSDCSFQFTLLKLRGKQTFEDTKRENCFLNQKWVRKREGHTFTQRILWNDSIRKRHGFWSAPACAGSYEIPCLWLPGRCLICIASLGDILKVSCTTVVHAAANMAIQRDVPCMHTAGISLTLCSGSEVDSTNPGPMIALLFLHLVFREEQNGADDLRLIWKLLWVKEICGYKACHIPCIVDSSVSWESL